MQFYTNVKYYYQDIKEVELQVANAIYMQDNFQVFSEFTTVSTDVFNCGLSIIDFKNKLQAINEINSWVKKATRDKISTILSTGTNDNIRMYELIYELEWIITNIYVIDDIDEDTRAILINAVYFKGHWLHKFDDKLIKNIFFHTSETDKKLVPMMYKRSKYVNGEISNLNARFIEIPYIVSLNNCKLKSIYQFMIYYFCQLKNFSRIKTLQW